MQPALRARGRPAPPRFDLRFERGRGRLRLAKPLDVGPGVIDQLDVSFGPITFPVDVSRGAIAFRHRATRVQTLRFRVEPTRLARFLEDLLKERVGVSLVHLSVDGRSITVGCEDTFGVIAFRARPFPVQTDVGFLIEDVRSVRSGPTPSLARTVALLEACPELRFDPGRGVLVWNMPLRRLLAEALVVHGFRLPDTRGVELVTPRVDNGTVFVEAFQAGSFEGGEGDPDRTAETARLVAPVTRAVVGGDLDAARVAAGRLGAEAFRLATSLDRSLFDGSTEPHSAATALASAFHVALAGGRPEAIEEAVSAWASEERVGALAVEALEVAVEALAEVEPARAASLAARGIVRRPLSRLLVEHALGPAAVKDFVPFLQTAERVVGALRPNALHPKDRSEPPAGVEVGFVQIVGHALAEACAEAMDHSLASRDEARRAAGLAADLMELAPEEAESFAAVASACVLLGDYDGAIERYDRASETAEDRGDGARAAVWLCAAASLAEKRGREEAAEERLRRAVALDPFRPALRVALAGVQTARGGFRRAAATWWAVFEMAPESPGFVDALAAGARFFEATDVAAARAFLERLHRYDPTHVVASTDLASPSGPRDSGSRVSEPRGLSSLPPEVTRPPGVPVLFDESDVMACVDASVLRLAAKHFRVQERIELAALALGRSGYLARDAATLRAAFRLAREAESASAQGRVVELALQIVGDGPARQRWIALRDGIDD